MQYPPTVRMIRVVQLKGLFSSNPKRYPAIEENTTLTANPALVISLKSVVIVFSEKGLTVAFNALFFSFFVSIFRNLCKGTL